MIDDNKYDNEEDHIPVTNALCSSSTMDTEREAFIAAKVEELAKKHCKEFMKRAFLLQNFSNNIPLTTSSAMIKMCRPQSDIDYIIYCLRNWEVGVCIKTIEHCPLRDRIGRQNNLGNKYVKQYVLEEVQVPRSDTPCTVLQRREKGVIGQIVVSREEVLGCIDEWHQSNGHMDQERT